MTKKIQFTYNKKKALIIAEIGLTHKGSIKKAKKFIDKCVSAGADVVKFQTHFAESESTFDEPFRVSIEKKYKNRFDYWNKTAFTINEWSKIIDYCKKKNIIFQTSPFSVDAVNRLRKLGCVNWKLGSGEVFDYEIFDSILKKKDSLVISSGLSTFSDIKKQYNYIRKKTNNFAILQCTSSYPCELKNVGLNIIKKMKNYFNCPVGLSDHTGIIFSSLSAIAIGAKVIEVHVCESKKDKGPDTTSSITFDELKFLVDFNNSLDFFTKSKINKEKLSEKQKKLKVIFTKSLSLKRNMKKGEILKIDNITLKKPGYGLQKKDIQMILNKKARKDISKYRLLKKEFF